MASAYGWTPDEIDQVDAQLLDWLVAIQGVEAEIHEQQRQKQQLELKKATQKTRRRG